MQGFTTLGGKFDCYDESALLERLTNGVSAEGKPIVFLVGSALTAPTGPGLLGVPGIDGVIGLIEGEFDEDHKRDLQSALAGSDNRYQEAFRFLLGRRGPQAANAIIRKAVAAARNVSNPIHHGYTMTTFTSDDGCRAFDSDVAGWSLSLGVAALGELAARESQIFGRTILTTNFDPLIGVSIAAAGGTSFRTVLHQDGNFGQAAGAGTHVVHLHGYWHGSDTLHTPRQLSQPRPQLQAALGHLIRDHIVVVLAYGGWEDAFTQAIVDVVIDNNAYPEIIWCLRGDAPTMRTKRLTEN